MFENEPGLRYLTRGGVANRTTCTPGEQIADESMGREENGCRIGLIERGYFQLPVTGC